MLQLLTGLSFIKLPNIALRFGIGVVMDLDDRQFMYFFREHQDDDFPFGCLAFAPAPDVNFPYGTSLGHRCSRQRRWSTTYVETRLASSQDAAGYDDMSNNGTVATLPKEERTNSKISEGKI